jgi:hypothetical protein
MPNFVFSLFKKDTWEIGKNEIKTRRKKDKCLRDTFHQIAITQWQQQHTRERNRNNNQRTHNRSRPSPSSCTHNPPYSSLGKNTINQFARLKKEKRRFSFIFPASFSYFFQSPQIFLSRREFCFIFSSESLDWAGFS